MYVFGKSQLSFSHHYILEERKMLTQTGLCTSQLMHSLTGLYAFGASFRVNVPKNIQVL